MQFFNMFPQRRRYHLSIQKYTGWIRCVMFEMGHLHVFQLRLDV